MSYVSRERKKEKKQLRQKNRNNIIKQSLRALLSMLYKLCKWNTFFIHLFSDTNSWCCVYVSFKLIRVRKKYKILHISMIPPLYKNNL